MGLAGVVRGWRLARRDRTGWPLRWYLVGLVVVFVVTAGAAMVYGWVAADRDARATALGAAGFGARLAAQEVGSDVAALRQAVTSLAGNPEIGQAFVSPAGCSLQFQLPGGADAGHLDLIRSDGTVVCSSRPPASAGAGLGSYARASWWPPTTTSSNPVAPVPDTRTGRPAALVTAPVPGGGVVAGFIDLVTLGRTLTDLYAGPRALVYVVTTGDGAAVLTRSADPARWIGTRLGGTPFGTGPGVGERHDVTGQIRLYQRADAAGLGWRVYAGVDRATALSAARLLAWRQVLIIGAGLVVALLAAGVVHRRIAAPIGRLATAVGGAADAPAGPGAAVALPGPRPAEVGLLDARFRDLMASVARELTERQAAELAAEAAQRSYRELFDHNPFPILVLDTDSLRILEVNTAALEQYGYSRAEFLALTLSDLRLPEDRPALRQAVDARPAPDGTVRGATVRHVRKDGTVMDVVVTSHPLTFQGRAARCAVIEDVTDKESAERRLRAAQRMESLGQLAGGIAHDFNNLLGVIAGYTTFAVDDLGAAARTDPRWQPLHEDLTQVLKATDRAAALTRQLLAFARREVTRPQVVDLNTVVTDVEAMLRRTIGDDIDLRTRLAPGLPAVTADPGQLEQILLNLAVNARDAMPTGGTLAVETDTLTIDAHYAAQRPGTRPGRYVRLRVSDTGTGMSRDTVERAFEPFFTTKPTGQGTGLGLATVYGIVTAAGGHIHLHSTPGVGTTVTVLLPATHAPAGAPVPDPGTRRVGTGRGETILVVEDEDALRELTERLLIRHGHKVLTAPNGPTALQVAAAHAGPIDLLVTDVVMPDMPGHELAEHLRHTRPGLPVVYVSGYAQPILATQKTLPPDVTLLDKPVPEQVLLDAVRDALDGGRVE